MKAEIVSSGTELLLGEIVDYNTPFLASQLAMLGIDLYYTATVGDNFERFSGVLRQAWNRSDLIITTGGLGPTHGDITREVIAGLVGEKIAVNAELKRELADFFARRGLEMPESNIKQATLIPSAVPLRNLSGTAPGWWVEKEGRIIVALPGPPGEMQVMWQSEVLPRLEAKSGAVILSRMIKTWGLPEAKVDELVSPFLAAANPTLAIYAKPDGIQLRITAKATTREAATALISGREQDIRELLKDYVWGVDNETLEGVVGQLLSARKISLAVAESFTGGWLAYSVASIPESHGYFKGGITVVSDDARASLDIKSEHPSGKASAATASRMASWVRARFASDVGMAIDGYCEAAGNAVTGRIFIAIDTGVNRGAIAPSYPGSPQQIIRRAVNHALVYLRNFIQSL